jgi:hypothetical protein
MSLLAQTRPRRAIELVDASFRFYRAHAPELIVLAALLLVPPILIRALMPAGIGIVIQFLSNLLLIVCQAATAVLVAGAFESDRAVSAGDALRGLGARSGSAIVVAVASGIMVMLGLILLLVPGVIAAAWTSVAVPVVAIEGLTGSAAIKRSRELARGHIGHVLGTMFIAWIIVFCIVFGGAIALGMVMGMLHITGGFSELIGGLLLVPLFPLIGVASALLYHDLRVRRDGADVAAMADGLV